MPTPGEQSSDCPRCGNERVMVGYDTAVIGAYCETCDLTVTIDDSMPMREVSEHTDEWNPDEWEQGAQYGPDPNP